MPKNSDHVLATDREVKNAKPRGKRAEYRVKGAPGLVLRVSAKGAKSWTFLFASPSTRQRCKMALGPYPSLSLSKAKDMAQRLVIEVRDGHDPLVQRSANRSAETFAALADRYMAEHKRKNTRSGKRSRWTEETQRLLDRDILPVIGTHKAEAITRQQIMVAVEAVAERGSYAIAGKVLALVRAIYRWAAATGRLEVDPTRALKKRNAGRPRERILSNTEIRSLWSDLDASGISPEIRDALRLQLLLGLRIGEALGASKSENDLEHRVWVIPANRTKSNREHRLPLPPLATSILKSAIERTGDATWLFPSRIDDGPTWPKSAMRAILRLQKLQERPSICAAFENWRSQNRRPAYPATPGTVAAWISSLSKGDDFERLSRSVVRVHVSAILTAQRASGNQIDRKHSAIAAILRAAPEARPKLGAERLGFSTHDLRRTFATGLGDKGVPDEVIERLLNHAPRSVTGRHYNHSRHFQPMRCALEAWERHVLAVVEGRQPQANFGTLRLAGE